MDTPLPRTRRRSVASMRTTSAPSSKISPPVIRPFAGKSRNSAAARVLFPDPDSPSTARISPASTPKLTPLSARHTPPPRRPYATQRSRTSRTRLKSVFPLVLFMLSHRHYPHKPIVPRPRTNSKHTAVAFDRCVLQPYHVSSTPADPFLSESKCWRE